MQKKWPLLLHCVPFLFPSALRSSPSPVKLYKHRVDRPEESSALYVELPVEIAMSYKPIAPAPSGSNHTPPGNLVSRLILMITCLLPLYSFLFFLQGLRSPRHLYPRLPTSGQSSVTLVLHLWALFRCVLLSQLLQISLMFCCFILTSSHIRSKGNEDLYDNKICNIDLGCGIASANIAEYLPAWPRTLRTLIAKSFNIFVECFIRLLKHLHASLICLKKRYKYLYILVNARWFFML